MSATSDTHQGRDGAAAENGLGKNGGMQEHGPRFYGMDGSIGRGYRGVLRRSRWRFEARDGRGVENCRRSVSGRRKSCVTTKLSKEELMYGGAVLVLSGLGCGSRS